MSVDTRMRLPEDGKPSGQGFGIAIPVPTGAEPAVPFEWDISRETQAAISEIEANIGMARRLGSTFLVD